MVHHARRRPKDVPDPVAEKGAPTAPVAIKMPAMAQMAKPIGLVLLLVSMASCGREQIVQSSFIDLPGHRWPADSVLRFDHLHEGGTEHLQLVMDLRHDIFYPYSNLYLFRSIEQDGEIAFQDTVEVRMADPYGNWNGTGSGKIRTLEFPFRKQTLKLTQEAEYSFLFRHGMRDDPLKGVRSLGLTFIRINDTEKED